MEPALSKDIVAASFCGEDAQVRPTLLAGAWLKDALEHGAVLTGGAPVQGFVRQGGAVCGVVAGGREYAAAAVVLAAGVWAGELAAMAGASVDIRPRRGLLLRSQPGAPPIASRPLLGAGYLRTKLDTEGRAAGFSFQQHPDGECVLGGTREFVGFSTDGLDEASAEVRRLGESYVPALRAIAWEQAEWGFRPWTPDGLPRIGPCEVPGLLLASGHEGDGITLAAVTAERIAALLG